MKTIAILVPGIMGSVLKLGDEIIWPGPLTSLWFPYRRMKELLHDDLIATDCIRMFSVTTQYQSLIDDLANCGYSEDEGTLIIGAYDWRKDNAESANKLAEYVDTAVQHHGANVEISLVAHSMGGLVARYYLESGKFNDRLGFGRVRRLLTLGTPHRGAALALRLVLGYEKRFFLSKEQVLQATSDPRYPSAYQLLPPAGEPFAWSGAADQQFEPLDIYAAEVSKPLGLVEANIEAAARFRAGLDLERRPGHVRYFCFVGTRQTTTTHILLRPAGGGTLRPEMIEEEDGGDGTVPTWSGFTSALQRQFVGGEHGTIYQNRSLRAVLATLLGKPGVLAGVPAQAEVAVRDRVVEPGDPVHVVVGFSEVIQDFSGVLTVERAQTDPISGIALAFDPPQQLYPVTYKGLGMETMALRFDAPDLPGVYRVAFRDAEGAKPSGFDELIVQQP